MPIPSVDSLSIVGPIDRSSSKGAPLASPLTALPAFQEHLMPTANTVSRAPMRESTPTRTDRPQPNESSRNSPESTSESIPRESNRPEASSTQDAPSAADETRPVDDRADDSADDEEMDKDSNDTEVATSAGPAVVVVAAEPLVELDTAKHGDDEPKIAVTKAEAVTTPEAIETSPLTREAQAESEPVVAQLDGDEESDADLRAVTRQPERTDRLDKSERTRSTRHRSTPAADAAKDPLKTAPLPATEVATGETQVTEKAPSNESTGEPTKSRRADAGDEKSVSAPPLANAGSTSAEEPIVVTPRSTRTRKSHNRLQVTIEALSKSTRVDAADRVTTEPVPASTAEGPVVSRPLARMLEARTGRLPGAEGEVPAVDQARFAQRVARALEAAQHRDGPIRLRLHPPELGSVRLEVRMSSGAMSARLETETPAARTLLMENLGTLRDRLAEQGVRIEKFDVELSDRQSNSYAGTPQQHDPRQPWAPTPRTDHERIAASEATDLTRPVRRFTSTTELDVTI